MTLHIYNTLHRSIEKFVPIDAGKVSLYTCGPTVYNVAHIGNFRAYIFEDLLRRTLIFCGYDVTQVMNITDVDDKTIFHSRQQGLSLSAFTDPYKKAFFADLETLGIEKAEHYPCATDYIPEMISLIETLIAKNYAYISEDHSVYFSVSRFKSYGQLVHIDLSEQRSGERIQADEYDKENIADFALWKHWDEKDGDVFWDSPWGKGRPGWHIECSAMSMKHLGNHFDIHTGGIDNVFPHHEDEIAQCEAATGEKFVNYWLHCAHLVVDGEKMSKSLGNFYTLRDLLNQGYTGREIRWLLLSTHYRQPLNFTFQGLDTSRSILQRIDDFIHRLQECVSSTRDTEISLAETIGLAAKETVRKSLEDDLNISAAIAAVFHFMKEANKEMDAKNISGKAAKILLQDCKTLDQVLGIFSSDHREEVPPFVQQKLQDRITARKRRDYSQADALRKEIMELGWRVDDTPQGTRVVKLL